MVAPPAGAAYGESRPELDARPRVTLRARIALVFAICALFIAGITGGSLVMLSRFGSKLRFLEAADECAFEMQEARRFEKNFLLYGTTLHDALDHARRAGQLLEANRADVEDVIGRRAVQTWLDNLRQYEALLEQLAQTTAGPPPPGSTATPARSQATLRRLGGALLDDASAMIRQERQAMNAMIRSAMLGAVIFVGFMVILMVVLADQLARQVLRPIGRFVHYVERIGEGDFSPIRPARRYRDEFCALAVAMNRMVDELTVRQEQLVRSGKLAAAGTLASGIAHELSNPLNNIRLTVETLLEEYGRGGDERLGTLLADISTQSDRASATVRNLLDFTRKDHPVRVSLVLPQILETALKLVSHELSLARVRVHLDLAPEIPPLRGNPGNLQQVFLNLFLNAIQAMPGGGDLTVDARRDDGFVRICVHDTGPGIPEADLAKVFEPFYTTKAPGAGTGLGLAVSQSIVHQHGGRIEVRSAPGHGAAFVVFLPASPHLESG